ncbi:MAG: hypothetical protein VCD31_04555 [Alphaproteobacteria bacterium]
MPDECSVVHISPLLRELLITAVDIPLDRPPEERHEYIMKLILEEIRTLPTLPLYLPYLKARSSHQVAATLSTSPVRRTRLKLARNVPGLADAPLSGISSMRQA